MSLNEKKVTISKKPDLNPYRKLQLNGPKIASGALLGLVAGAAGVFLYQVSKNITKRKHRLDPPAPEMEEADPDLANHYRILMGHFYRMSPDSRKEEYKSNIKDAIQCGEYVCVIESQLKLNLKTAENIDLIQAKYFYQSSLEFLKKCSYMFSETIEQDYTAVVNAISVKWANHITNIETLIRFSKNKN